MGNACCSLSNNGATVTINDLEYQKVTLKPNPPQLPNTSSKSIHELILQRIIIQTHKVTKDDIHRIKDFAQANHLQIFGNISNQQTDTIQSKKAEEDIPKQPSDRGQINHEDSMHLEITNKYYFGEFAEGKAQGLGMLYQVDKYYYMGNFQEGKASGQGILHFIGHIDSTQSKISQEYEGNFVQGKAHGHGKYLKYSYGESLRELEVQFLGEWLVGEPTSGSVKFSNKSDIKYLEIHDIKTREGTIHLKSGGQYKGHLNTKLEPQGIGSYISSNNEEYKGEWGEGKFHGNGKFIWNSGETYEGQYFQGKKQGYGRFIYESGKQYIGNWLKGRQNGRGTLYNKKGEILKRGLWINGEFNMEIQEQNWGLSKEQII